MTRVAVGIAAMVVIAFVAWFVGFSLSWAAAAALAGAPVVALIATLSFDEPAPWEPPPRDPPRGSRLAVATIEQSLAACDRLASPTAVRRLRAALTPEREDRVARSLLVRRVRALLDAELRDRGIDPLERPDDAVALLGHDALAILQPHDDTPVTAAAIARCLDAVEQHAATTPGSR